MQYCYLLTSGLIFKTTLVITFDNQGKSIKCDGKVYTVENKYHSDATAMSFKIDHIIADWQQ